MCEMAENHLEIGKLIAENNLYRELSGGQFGIEIEQHRVTAEGRLSRRTYPASLGSRTTHPYLQTDYSETQSELVTEPVGSFEAARDFLLQLQWVMRDHMSGSETIWPLSMPPKLTADDLQWVDETFDRPWMQDYRDWLAKKYGSTHEIITGLHLNYSLPETLLEKLFALSDEADYVTFKNAVYFKLAQQIAAHRWLFVYLFGAAPFSMNDTDSRVPRMDQPVRSIRTSQFGFANDGNIRVDYATNLADHFNQIKTHIARGELFSNHEFYGTVRFKGREDYDDMLQHGVEYLELRILDADPFDPAGISENALNLIHLLLLHFVMSDREYSATELIQSDSLANQIALQRPVSPLPNKADAMTIMSEISQLADHFGMRFNDGLSLVAERILTPAKTPAARIIATAGTPEALQEWATELGNQRYELFRTEHDAQFAALFGTGQFAKLVAEAMVVGIRVKNWTRTDLTLAVDDHEETIQVPVPLATLFPERYVD